MTRPPWHLEWSGCRNARDIGGLPARDGRTTRYGVLIRSESLHRLDPDGVRAATAHGVGTVIDLRSDWELDDEVHPFAGSGTYRRIPWIDDVCDADRDPEAERTLADMYRGSLDRNTGQVGAIVRAVADSRPPVVVHCHSGKDRTGLLVALLLDLVGVPRDEIAADYAASEQRLGLLDRPVPADGGPPDLFSRTPPETIREALDHLDRRYGGTRDYLLTCGVPAEILDRLTRRLLSG